MAGLVDHQGARRMPGAVLGVSYYVLPERGWKATVMTMVEMTVDVADFETRSVVLLEGVARGDVSRITVTREGQVLATVQPAGHSPGELAFDRLYGSMRHRTFIAPGVDLTEPTIDPDWEDEMLKDWDEQMK